MERQRERAHKDGRRQQMTKGKGKQDSAQVRTMTGLTATKSSAAPKKKMSAKSDDKGGKMRKSSTKLSQESGGQKEWVQFVNGTGKVLPRTSSKSLNNGENIMSPPLKSQSQKSMLLPPVLHEANQHPQNKGPSPTNTALSLSERPGAKDDMTNRVNGGAQSSPEEMKPKDSSIDTTNGKDSKNGSSDLQESSEKLKEGVANCTTARSSYGPELVELYQQLSQEITPQDLPLPPPKTGDTTIQGHKESMKAPYFASQVPVTVQPEPPLKTESNMQKINKTQVLPPIPTAPTPQQTANITVLGSPVKVTSPLPPIRRSPTPPQLRHY